MSKKIVTKKQQTILTLLLSFRFLNSKHIQLFLQHKDHRRSNAWLKDLHEKEYIERDFKPRFGTLTKPAVYNLSVKGRNYIRSTYEHVSRTYLARVRDDKKRSKSFRIGCQVIADCYLILFPDGIMELVETIKAMLKGSVQLGFNKLQFFTPAFYEELDFILLPKLKPDGYFYKRTQSGITHILFYVLDAYISRMMLHYFLKHIFTVLDEEYWEDENISVLHFNVVCPNNAVVIYLKRRMPSLLEAYSGKELLFHFTTRNQLYKRQQNKTGHTNWTTISSTDY